MPIQELIRKAVTNIKLIVEAQQQKPVIIKYQLLLFPEQDAKLFYKIIFGRWLFWLTIMLLFTNLLRFSIHWSDNQKEIKLQLVEKDRIKRAWFRLYSQPNKNLKRLMDTAYYKSEVGEQRVYIKKTETVPYEQEQFLQFQILKINIDSA